jgi:hypothetical protein
MVLILFEGLEGLGKVLVEPVDDLPGVGLQNARFDLLGTA